jgi:S1-C subfamily serine protease
VVVSTAGVGSGISALDGPDGTAREAASGAQGGCDYATLYDQTVPALVTVQSAAGEGSGFVARGVRPDDVSENRSVRYVVTNAHVVGDSRSVLLQFVAGEYREGTVVSRDRFSDLAVIRVPQTPAYVESLPVSTAPPQHGQRVAALGNPLGLEASITEGIVSGLNRTIPTTLGFTIPNVVQTDAAISAGNSGGPLVDCRGSVVGVNTAAIVGLRAENVGFAVSAKLVNQVVPTLARGESFDYPFLGITTTELFPPVARANNVTTTQGALVVSVVAGGPASAVLQESTGVSNVSGVRAPVGGDVIVEIDDREVADPVDLNSYLVTETRPGEDVELTILRNGTTKNVTTTLEGRPSPDTV